MRCSGAGRLDLAALAAGSLSYMALHLTHVVNEETL